MQVHKTIKKFKRAGGKIIRKHTEKRGMADWCK
jgi:hypothetical protein